MSERDAAIDAAHVEAASLEARGHARRVLTALRWEQEASLMTIAEHLAVRVACVRRWPQRVLGRCMAFTRPPDPVRIPPGYSLAWVLRVITLGSQLGS